MYTRNPNDYASVVGMCAYACVCVREKERESDREKEREELHKGAAMAFVENEQSRPASCGITCVMCMIGPTVVKASMDSRQEV